MASIEGNQSSLTKGIPPNTSFIKEEESGEPSVKGEGKAIENIVPVTAFSSMVHSPPMIGPLVSSSEAEGKSKDSVKDPSLERKSFRNGRISIKKIKTGSLVT